MLSAAITSESPRLQIARLRLAEAQGKVPRGTSEMVESRSVTGGDSSSSSSSKMLDLEAIKAAPIRSSTVREISWRVAEPAVTYDPDAAAQKLLSQPLKWLTRNVQIFVPIAIFTSKILVDVITKKEEGNRNTRAEEILTIISSQSPALIKAGQALSSRSDLLPKEYLESLQKLQDRCPAFATSEALLVFEKETGKKFSDVFDYEAEDFRPVAAASIGQVYKARLRSNGAEVAVKIQVMHLPACLPGVCVRAFVRTCECSIG